MSDLHEYVITLHSMDDLDEFYDDMEIIGGTDNIPDRKIPVFRRRPISKSTHYMLSYEEAELIKADSRVAGVELVQMVLDSIVPLWTTASNSFDKSSTNDTAYYNWGLKRCVAGTQTANWGSDSTSNNSSTVKNDLSGKNVDVVIVDGHFDPLHPEFAVNADGTGGSRVNQFNWFSLNSVVTSIDDDGLTASGTTYVYTPYTGSTTLENDNNNHGCHVAGTVAGNTNGWARDATIYNMNPYSTNPNSISVLLMWDYIRAFHRSKSVNSETGYKKPTICNCSYGSSYRFPYSGSYTTGSIVQGVYRGTVIGDKITALTTAQLNSMKLRKSGSVTIVPYFSTSLSSDIQQAIDDGIIIVGSAGNDSAYIDAPTGLDYANYFYATYGGTMYPWDCHKGSTPGSVSNVITVGAISSLVNEVKATFSNTGPGIDIYAPGQNIMSSFNNTSSWGGSTDPRTVLYFKGKIDGTSMASPQVCGVLACALQQYPNMNQSEALTYITTHAKLNQMTTTSGGITDTTDLQSAPNRYLYAPQERKSTDYVFPKFNFKIRPATGQTYPRVKRRVYK